MKINILEEKLERYSDEKYSSIIELIVSAVRDYPLKELEDTDDYFNEVKKLLGGMDKRIMPKALKEYIENNLENERDNNFWIISSLDLLLDAFDLMKIYHISFDEVLEK